MDRQKIKSVLAELRSVIEFILGLPGEVLEYMLDHKWAANLLAIVIGIVTYLITITALVYLRMAGYTP